MKRTSEEAKFWRACCALAILDVLGGASGRGKREQGYDFPCVSDFLKVISFLAILSDCRSLALMLFLAGMWPRSLKFTGVTRSKVCLWLCISDKAWPGSTV
jgi:hypothetical protein